MTLLIVIKLRSSCQSSPLSASPHMIIHVLIELLHHARKNGDIRAITHGAMDQRVCGRTDGQSLLQMRVCNFEWDKE